MENRLSRMENHGRTVSGLAEVDWSAKTGAVPGPQPIGAVLAELLAQYQARFPEVRIAVVETPAVAI